MLPVIRHEAFALFAPFHRHLVAKDIEIRQSDVRVLVHHVGFSVVLVVAEVPPMRGSTLWVKGNVI